MACRQEHLTRDFAHALCTSDCVHTHCMAQDESRLRSVSVRLSFHPHVILDVMCLELVGRSLFLSLSLVSLRLLPLLFHTPPVPGTPSSMSTPPRVKTTAHTQNEEYCPMAIYNPLTGYEPKLLDDFDHSETSAMILQDESGDIDTGAFVLVQCGTRR